MPYRPILHRSIAITLAVALTLAAGACAGAPQGGTAPTPRPSATAQPVATADPSATFDPDTYQPPPIAPASLPHRFAYDASAPLDIRAGAVRRQGTVTITTITYLVRPTERVTAVLVSSPLRGPGVVYAHGGQSDDPDAFLANALTLVAHGGAAILPDIGITMVGDPATDLAYVVDTVTAERRALDILARRSDVDPHRLAFVGHSWGAELAAIMSGIEPRLSAVVITCGWSRMSTDMADTASVPASDLRSYLAATTVLDGFRYVALPGARKILIQYGTQDPNIPQAQRTELIAAARGSVTHKNYDAGHDLVGFAAAAADRDAFLRAK